MVDLVNVNDITALLLQAVTINTNAWTNAGHAVNQVYDMLYMMRRDDTAVGVGGEGGILEDGTILPNVGGYHPIIEQGNSTAAYCRYRQATPVGLGGRLDIDTNFGFRKSFLPQGRRRYVPLYQPTAQQVIIDEVSAGPITVFIIGANTNFDYTSNPYAEFNMFGDPCAAYQVIHSGIPVTLVPLDATNTIPISMDFFELFEKNQHTYEAQYCFIKTLKMARDTWFYDNENRNRWLLILDLKEIKRNE
ncbi:inosine-uridine preferring nucleoside hydrolase family protein [Perilla frutescens var. hirtella]|nr:inosine-uridine preferring nucleoside hydrolase family protein [Perilla frutescens var. hirtella]